MKSKTDMRALAASSNKARVTKRKSAATPGKPECKHCVRHKAGIAKLTSSANGKESKQLFFDEKWLSVRWGVSIAHIRKLRYSGEGPKVTYFNSAVRYRLRHITTYEKASLYSSRSDMDVSKASGPKASAKRAPQSTAQSGHHLP